MIRISVEFVRCFYQPWPVVDALKYKGQSNLLRIERADTHIRPFRKAELHCIGAFGRAAMCAWMMFGQIVTDTVRLQYSFLDITRLEQIALIEIA